VSLLLTFSTIRSRCRLYCTTYVLVVSFKTCTWFSYLVGCLSLNYFFFVLRAVHVIAGLFDRYIWDPVWDWLVRRASSGGVPKEMAADLAATPMFQPTMSALVGRMVSRAKIDSRAAQLAVSEMQVAI
jgi:hypothetical protein